MSIESVNTEMLLIEVSQMELTKDGRVYIYFEHYNGGDIEVYVSPQDFKSIVKMFMRLDEQLVI